VSSWTAASKSVVLFKWIVLSSAKNFNRLAVCNSMTLVLSAMPSALLTCSRISWICWSASSPEAVTLPLSDDRNLSRAVWIAWKCFRFSWAMSKSSLMSSRCRFNRRSYSAMAGVGVDVVGFEIRWCGCRRRFGGACCGVVV